MNIINIPSPVILLLVFYYYEFGFLLVYLPEKFFYITFRCGIFEECQNFFTLIWQYGSPPVFS